MSENLPGAVKSLLQQAKITPAHTIVIGVSGGPDSLALLHILAGMMAPDCLVVAHLNHGLRPEAAAEAAFVGQEAAAHGLRFHDRKVDVAGLAREQGWSIEEAGRIARYRFLGDVVEESLAEALLVAHNADDQAETVLHNILRGSGLRGLQGMRPLSSLPGRDDIRLIRPLLAISRRQIEAYCHEHELQPMLDSTNKDPAYLRNRLRHELLPLLADYNPRVREHLRSLAAIVAADEAYLEAQTAAAWPLVLSAKGAGWLRLDRQKWRALPLSLRRRTLRRALLELRPSLSDISYRTIDLAHDVGMHKQTGAEATLPAAISLRLEYENLLLTAGAAQLQANVPQLAGTQPQTLPLPGTISLAGRWRLSAVPAEVNLSDLRHNPDPWVAYLDVGLRTDLQVRARLPGESMQPLGMGGRSATVQDIMVNRKLPAQFRDNWPVVATAEHALWLVGLHIDERAKVAEHTRRIVRLHCFSDPA